MPRKVYSDINIDFIPHPITGDVTLLFDENSVKRALKNLILTNYFEVPFDPTAGSNLRAYLFEPHSVIVEDAIEKTIEDIISTHEPRVSVISVNAKFIEAQNSYEISIEFTILALDNPINVKFILDRVR